MVERIEGRRKHLVDRYLHDGTFHRLAEMLAKGIRDKAFTMGDVFDALIVAEEILETDRQLREEMYASRPKPPNRIDRRGDGSDQ